MRLGACRGGGAQNVGGPFQNFLVACADALVCGQDLDLSPLSHVMNWGRVAERVLVDVVA